MTNRLFTRSAFNLTTQRRDSALSLNAKQLNRFSLCLDIRLKVLELERVSS